MRWSEQEFGDCKNVYIYDKGYRSRPNIINKQPEYVKHTAGENAIHWLNKSTPYNIPRHLI